MLATISATSVNREGAGSRLSHSLSRPATSFLIRDILGKCNNDLPSSDNDENIEAETQRSSKEENFSEEESEKPDSYRKNFSPVSNPGTLPTLCCRECINGQNTSDNALHKMQLLERPEAESQTPEVIAVTRHTDTKRHSENTGNETKSQINNRPLFLGLDLIDSRRQLEVTSSHKDDRSSSSSYPASPESDLSVEATRRDNFLKSSLGSATDKQPSLQHQYKSTKCGSDSWAKEAENQSRLSAPTQHYHEHRGHLQRHVIDKLKAASLYNQQLLYNNLYAGTQNLIEFNYALNLRALGIPQLALPLLSGYRGVNNHKESSFNLSKPFFKNETKRFETTRFEPYKRYRLLDWPQGALSNEAHGTSQSGFLASGITKDKNVVFLNSPKAQLSPSIHPPSPTFSDQSQTSSFSDKRPLQLPAYLRSQFGGSTSIDEKHGGGKAKKCRRSRTVFTELQVRSKVVKV